jgi:decaprenylphospho-beta-D-erythro-pentofuranosid-2-ulose 2-reductase
MRDAVGAVQSILVLGGASELGVAIASALARPRQARVVLAGRHPEALAAAARQVAEAGASRVEVIAFDAEATDRHDIVIDQAVDKVGDLDVVVLAVGVLGDQAADEQGGPGAVRVAMVNYVGAMSAALASARRLREQGHGTLVVLSSVAGERVRRDNFIYGSSKAAIDGLAQGLGDALVGSGARVVIVRPGFVVGRMTAGMPKAPFATTPAAVASAVVSGLAAGREVIWVPGVLRVVSVAMRNLPRPLWRRVGALAARERSGGSRSTAAAADPARRPQRRID